MTFNELDMIPDSLLIMRIINIILMILFCNSITASAETIYKTRDAEGNIIFTDKPSDGAEEIKIKEAQTLDIPMPVSSGERRTTKLSPDERDYFQFEIVSPEHDSTIHSNEGLVSVAAVLEPDLDDNHVIAFLMDGKEISNGKSLQFAMNNLDRGTHNITAVIKNKNDKEVKRSNTVIFHLRKASKLFNNSNNPTNSNPTNSATPAAPAVPSL